METDCLRWEGGDEGKGGWHCWLDSRVLHRDYLKCVMTNFLITCFFFTPENKGNFELDAVCFNIIQQIWLTSVYHILNLKLHRNILFIHILFNQLTLMYAVFFLVLFQDSLHSLMATLSASNPFFVRCIKPNIDKVGQANFTAQNKHSGTLPGLVKVSSCKAQPLRCYS